MLDLRELNFEVRVSGGPIHKGEASTYMDFESPHFTSAGLFVDLDFYQTEGIRHEDIPRLLKSAVELTWTKVERFAQAVGV